MNWDLIIVVSMLVLIGIFFVFLFNSTLNEESSDYQGPLRPTDDEDHFRKTGETIPLSEGG